MTTHRLRVLGLAACLLPADLVVGVSLFVAQLVGLILWRRRRVMSPRGVDATSVAIQILNWDGKHLLEQFLPSVLAAAKGHEVVVVDNGSGDGSVHYLRTAFPQVRVVELSENYGFSIGNNRGIDQVTTDIVVFLNNDMATDPEFLEPLLRPFSDPTVFAVASRIAVSDPEKSKTETGKTRGRFENGMFYLWHDPVTPQDEQRRSFPVFWAGGGACAVDRRKFILLGGFDELYHPFYVEDVDLSYQAWKRGWKCLFAPSSRVLHKHRATSSAKFGESFVNNTTRRNHFLFVWKNVTDFRMLVEHVAMLPAIHARAISQFGGAFEMKAYLRACAGLPLALARRLANGSTCILGDRDVLGLSQ